MIRRFVDIDQDARNFGFDWPNVEMIFDHISSEIEEVREALAGGESLQRVQEEIGDLIAASMSLCVFLGFDAEEVVSKQNDKFGKRIEVLKKLATERGLESLKGQSLEVSLELWKEVKKLEKTENETA